MDQPILRVLIQGKLADGRLPHTPIPRETCDGCGETVTKAQMAMEGLDAKGCGVRFHVACFHVWDVERQVPGHKPSARLPARSAFRTPRRPPDPAMGARRAASSSGKLRVTLTLNLHGRIDERDQE